MKILPTAPPGTPNKNVRVEEFLQRAVTLANAPAAPCAVDDIRMCAETGARFVGRCAYVWKPDSSDEEHFDQAARWAEHFHAQTGGECVLQAAIFEVVYPDVGNIPIPRWVFEDLDEPIEQRNFDFDSIRGAVPTPYQGGGVPWLGAAVPDLARPEARRWYYYRARKYIEAGYEAIHMGQIHMVAGADPGYHQLDRLFGKIRAAAHRYARRGWVLLDAHSHGIARDGKLLFDLLSRPISARPLLNNPENIALVRRGKSLGGCLPNGIDCEESPTLLELDNWFGLSLPPDSPDWSDLQKRAAAGRWGYDDINWFARLGSAERRDFLRYAHRWTRLQSPSWFFQIPLGRTLSRGAFRDNAGILRTHYRANRPSASCALGLGDEGEVPAIWAEPEPPRNQSPTPLAPDAHGLSVPQPVAIVGPLQALLGGVPGDASCPNSRLQPSGPGLFSRTFVLPLAGTFEFSIAVGGTATQLVNHGGQAGGPRFRLQIQKAGDAVRITFDHSGRSVTSVDAETGRDLEFGCR